MVAALLAVIPGTRGRTTRKGGSPKYANRGTVVQVPPQDPFLRMEALTCEDGTEEPGSKSPTITLWASNQEPVRHGLGQINPYSSPVFSSISFATARAVRLTITSGSKPTSASSRSASVTAMRPSAYPEQGSCEAI